MDDLKYWVAFSRIPLLGTARFQLLEGYFPSLRDAWQASAHDLKAAGLDSKTVTTVQARRGKIEPDEELSRLESAGVSALTWRDSGYPARLKEIPDPPPVLYVRGSLTSEDERSIAVVGTRKATAYGREAVSTLTADLASRRITIVSGLARGIDTEAHRTALEAGGRTIAVLAHGLDSVYPPENSNLARQITETGALISEHALGMRPNPHYFPRRTRLMSGISLGTLAVEAGPGSGAFWTVRHALEQNREVFCVPGSIFSPASLGTNQLIQEGAKLVLDYRDVLKEINLSALAQQAEMQLLIPSVEEEEARLLGVMTTEPIHIDEICRDAELPVSAVSSSLTLMELKGLVKRVGGMHYVRTREVAAAYGN